MYSKSDNEEIMINDKAHEFIKGIFHFFSSRYQVGLETPMARCEFVIDCVQLLYYKCHKTIQVMVDHL